MQIIFTSGATAEPKGVVIRHRNVLANIVPVEREVIKYRSYARPFHPLRFVNLLPLSHMFGQSMATNVPPMVRGTVIFTRSFNPHDIIRLIKSRRVSVLVCVPKILDVLREHVMRAMPEAQEAPPAGISIPGRWWRYRRVHSALGLKFWAFVVGRGAAAPRPRGVLATHGVRRHPGLRAHRNGADRHAESPVQDEQRIGRHADRRASRSRLPRTARSSCAARTSRAGITRPTGPKSRGPKSSTAQKTTAGSLFDAEGWFHTGDIGGLDEQGRLFIRGRKKEMIVTPEGLNVFPEDVERVLNERRRRARVGRRSASPKALRSACTPSSSSTPEPIPTRSIREANARLQDHQRITDDLGLAGNRAARAPKGRRS